MLEKQKAEPKKQNTGKQFAVGDRVKHRKFGVGTVVAAQSMGADTLLRIVFGEEEKKLLAAYAPIEKIED